MTTEPSPASFWSQSGPVRRYLITCKRCAVVFSDDNKRRPFCDACKALEPAPEPVPAAAGETDLRETIARIVSDAFDACADPYDITQAILPLFASLQDRASRAERERDKSGYDLHKAYLRLRDIIPGAHKTPFAPSAETVWAVTEAAAKALVAQRDAAEARARDAYEECARIAETFTASDWIAHDIRSGTFPKQGAPGAAIAQAIRSRVQEDQS